MGKFVKNMGLNCQKGHVLINILIIELGILNKDVIFYEYWNKD